MFKTVLWVAAACAAILLALAVSRALNFDEPVPKPARAPAVEAAPPPVEAPPAPPPVVEEAPPPLPPTPDEQQILDDAAATGMTTIEPEARVEPPTN